MSDLTADEIAGYARIALTALASAPVDDMDVADVLADETDSETVDAMSDADLARILAAMAGATVVVLLPGDLADTEDATGGVWEAVPLQTAKFVPPGRFDYRDVATVVGGDPERVTVTEVVDGNALFRPADARLIVALRNAYLAATTVAADTTEEETRT